jgi:hypothetical protein
MSSITKRSSKDFTELNIFESIDDELIELLFKYSKLNIAFGGDKIKKIKTLVLSKLKTLEGIVKKTNKDGNPKILEEEMKTIEITQENMNELYKIFGGEAVASRFFSITLRTIENSIQENPKIYQSIMPYAETVKKVLTNIMPLESRGGKRYSNKINKLTKRKGKKFLRRKGKTNKKYKPKLMVGGCEYIIGLSVLFSFMIAVIALMVWDIEGDTARGNNKVIADICYKIWSICLMIFATSVTIISVYALKLRLQRLLAIPRAEILQPAAAENVPLPTGVTVVEGAGDQVAIDVLPQADEPIWADAQRAVNLLVAIYDCEEPRSPILLTQPHHEK